MKAFMTKYHRFVFYGLWLLLALVQSGFTELIDDEAYYWVYSHYLDWGYFDHPPMIALMVRIGYAVFHNELGVRLLAALMNTGTLLLIEQLLRRQKPFLFYAIAFSLAALQLGGFMAVPDTPLIFFTALFFVYFKKFSENKSFTNTLLLGLVTALLLYSKYHGVLIVFFVLLSDRKLFIRYQTYLAGIVALVLFAPHLWWQYQHEWISVRYHLFESNVNPYKLSHTLDYITGQLLLPGPIAGFVLLPAAFFCRIHNSTEKALKFTLAGIYLFFFLSTFKGKVEANWTSPVLVPLVVLSHNFLADRKKWQKILYRLLPFTVVLVLIARAALIVDFIPVGVIKERYHSWQGWPGNMKKITKGLPVVFYSSYQRASKYWFYTGQMAYSLNTYRGRKNNYNLWPVEDSLLGKPVYILDTDRTGYYQDSLFTAIGWIGYRYDSAFASFAKIDIRPSKKLYQARQGDSLSITYFPNVPYRYAQFIESNHPAGDLRIAVFNKNGWVKDFIIAQNLEFLAAPQNGKAVMHIDIPQGEYYLRFAIGAGQNPPTHNSDKIRLIVE